MFEAAAALNPDRVEAMRAALAATPDPSPAIARAALGEVLDDVALFDIARFVLGIERFSEAAGPAPQPGLTLPRIDKSLSAKLSLGHGEHGGFYLDDRFDDRLAAARADAEAAGSAFRSAQNRIAAAVAAEAGLDAIRAGEFILMRDRVAAPPPNVRVIRETPAYFLCELILDVPALEKLERSDAAQARVAAIEEDVRRDISAAIRNHEAALLDARSAAGRSDGFLARVRFAQRHATCVPELVDDPLVAIDGASFLPLEARLRAGRRRYIPIALDLRGVGVVTGPNMGGKSAALRTCGFAAACAALGVPLPARSGRIALFDEIAWVGLGAEIEERADRTLLSAFGREVVDLARGVGTPRTAASLADRRVRADDDAARRARRCLSRSSNGCGKAMPVRSPRRTCRESRSARARLILRSPARASCPAATGRRSHWSRLSRYRRCDGLPSRARRGRRPRSG